MSRKNPITIGTTTPMYMQILPTARSRSSKFCLVERLPGTYALILRNRSKTTTNVGRWGWISLEKGYYIYIGSAFGPGGVQARVARHLRKDKRKHWHIDYLRDLMDPVGVWYTHDRQRLEHRWARLLSDVSSISSTHGFGCSDCTCDSHLFYAFMKSVLTLVPGVVGGEVETLYYRETAII